MQPLRFYSVEQNTSKRPEDEEAEHDKLYKRLEIELRGHDPMVMKSYVRFSTTAAKHLDIGVGRWYGRMDLDQLIERINNE